MKNRCFPPFLFLVMSVSAVLTAQGASIPINDQRLHLGEAGNPEWAEFAGSIPDARELEITFDARENEREWTLFLRQEDVMWDWMVELNGTRIGRLLELEEPAIHTLAVHAGLAREGSNTLRLVPPGRVDDILLQNVWIETRPLSESLADATLDVTVTAARDGSALPCRITITDDQGFLAPLQAAPGQSLAIRTGVAYTPDGRARLQLPAGNYRVIASRGFEYGIASRMVTLSSNDNMDLALSLAREVPTPGWVSCDTHVHTVTHSRHGDATIEERVVTLAGEGIELPVATDHNYHADYTEAAVRLGVRRWFTPIPGNEVTTSLGHFNIFPVDPEARVPNFRIPDRAALMQSILANPRVRVVILNHPRDVHAGFRPFGPDTFDPVTGSARGNLRIDFHAVELLNSSAQQPDWKLVYHDWFALLNRGHRIFGVGSSDSHDVTRYLVGQGRTYVRMDDEDPSALDIDAACRAFREGRLLVSMGLLTTMTVEERFLPGDLATTLPETIGVRIEVLGPSWVAAERVALYANGIEIRGAPINESDRSPESGIIATREWNIPKPPHDVHLVAIASGPGVHHPFWSIPRPYQRTSPDWHPAVVGSTNPIWIDADGDGRFSSARDHARLLWERAENDPVRLIELLRPCDAAVAVQAAAWCVEEEVSLSGESIQAALSNAPEPVREAFNRTGSVEE
ncbi:MAG TPA: CehA/McbA family metallohydrolase [Methylomirabilota bacterium]|nr:CehA/McbA family metallohydrolase [Methylomirabilota bacterium]